MKTYKVELEIFINEEDGSEYTNPEVMNLVNVDDERDSISAAPYEFEEGEVVTEDDIYLEECNYVDEQGTGTMEFAFKKSDDIPNTNFEIDGL